VSDDPDARKGPRRETDADVPSKRELQGPVGEYADEDGTWLSGTGAEESDPKRDEAAERARAAVEPGRPRE
jgi:hypothetical protein